MKKLISLLLVLALLCAAFTTAFAAEGTWICPTCGMEREKNFCPKDGTPRPSSGAIPRDVRVGDTVTFGKADMERFHAAFSNLDPRVTNPGCWFNNRGNQR